MNRTQAALVLLARFLTAPIYVGAGIARLGTWDANRALVEAAGLPAPELLLAGAVALLVAAGTAILFGFRTRAAAWLLIAFLIPVTVLFHDFWNVAGELREAQLVHFLKNLGLVGGLLLVAAFGPGSLSLDRQKPGKRRPTGRRAD